MLRGFKTTAERTVNMKAEFINNERRLGGQELSNDDDKIEKTRLSWGVISYGKNQISAESDM